MSKALWNVEKMDTGELVLTDPEGWWRATIRPDGCMELDHYFNEPLNTVLPENEEADYDRMHICDVDDLIERLRELKTLINTHFPE